MKIINLGESDSLLNQFIAEIRDKSLQKDELRFRRNLERIGEIFAYEISKTLNYEEKEVETPLGIASCHVNSGEMVLATIMRAGLPLHGGLLNFFDKARSSFFATYRKYGKDNKFTINIEYSSIPEIEGRTIVISDTMMATGASIELVYRAIRECGEPAHVHIVCPIASRDGVDFLSKSLPHSSITLWVGSIDEELTNKSFIIPGLGDAGDLAYGSKR